MCLEFWVYIIFGEISFFLYKGVFLMASTTEKKSILRWLHIAITVFFMFGFGFLPAPEPITPLGMQMLGVFLGLFMGGLL